MQHRLNIFFLNHELQNAKTVEEQSKGIFQSSTYSQHR